MYRQVFLSALLFTLIFSACDRLSVKDNISDESFELVNQNGENVTFPDDYTGSTLLIGYVYTKCPDICPVITYNMRDVYEKLGEGENIQFVSVSFDPTRDTPQILSQYAESYKIDHSNWHLLTGDRDVVDQLLERLEIAVVKTPTRFTDDGEAVYFLDHTDRVTLIDEKGNLRRNYYGSELNSDEVLSDIKTVMNQDN